MASARVVWPLLLLLVQASDHLQSDNSPVTDVLYSVADAAGTGDFAEIRAKSSFSPVSGAGTVGVTQAVALDVVRHGGSDQGKLLLGFGVRFTAVSDPCNLQTLNVTMELSVTMWPSLWSRIKTLADDFSLIFPALKPLKDKLGSQPLKLGRHTWTVDWGGSVEKMRFNAADVLLLVPGVGPVLKDLFEIMGIQLMVYMEDFVATYGGVSFRLLADVRAFDKSVATACTKGGAALCKAYVSILQLAAGDAGADGVLYRREGVDLVAGVNRGLKAVGIVPPRFIASGRVLLPSDQKPVCQAESNEFWIALKGVTCGALKEAIAAGDLSKALTDKITASKAFRKATNATTAAEAAAVVAKVEASEEEDRRTSEQRLRDAAAAVVHAPISPLLLRLDDIDCSSIANSSSSDAVYNITGGSLAGSGLDPGGVNNYISLAVEEDPVISIAPFTASHLTSASASRVNVTAMWANVSCRDVAWDNGACGPLADNGREGWWPLWFWMWWDSLSLMYKALILTGIVLVCFACCVWRWRCCSKDGARAPVNRRHSKLSENPMVNEAEAPGFEMRGQSHRPDNSRQPRPPPGQMKGGRPPPSRAMV